MDQYIFRGDDGEIFLSVGVNSKGKLVAENLKTGDYVTFSLFYSAINPFYKVVISEDIFDLCRVTDQTLRQQVCDLLGRDETF